MSGIGIYLLLLLLVFIINVIPAFMPPTWIILSYLYLQFNLAFIPTVILGVIAATSGRAVLAIMARSWFRKYLPHKFIANYDHLGKYLKDKQKLTITFVLGYAFSPISSNSLFIIAGLSEMKLSIIIFSFFIGRLFTYSLMLATSMRIANQLDKIFIGHLTSSKAVISAIISLAIVLIIGKINWGKILHTERKIK
jgi:membrane protein YqaA with SNARE-associated domain